MEPQAIYSFMAQFRYGVVSSMADDGTPQSALVGIATTPDLEIVFDTVKSSRKYPNLNPAPLVLVRGGLGRRADGAVRGHRDRTRRRRAALVISRQYFAVWPDGPDAHGLAGDRLLRRTPEVDPLQRL